MKPPNYDQLLTRLPRTFAPALNDQLRQWELLFPAEQRTLQAQFDWLAALPAGELKALFAPLAEVEDQMELPRWDARHATLTVEDTGVLARSPLYPRWRSEVGKVFARIDEGIQPSVKHYPRLLICLLPAGLPLAGQRLWAEVEKKGTWTAIEKPFGAHWPVLARAIAARPLAAGLDPLESTWIFESEARLAELQSATTATVFGWAASEALRREFSTRLNAVSRDLKAVDQTNLDLRKLEIGKLVAPVLAAQPRLREFLRSVLLSGNGSLVFPNSFVQWGASEAIRRAEPQALLACFGMRAKLKPFSSMVLFEDQHRANPTADEDDPAGSLMDALLLSQYVHLSAERQPAYQGRTLTVFAAAELDRVLLVGSKAPARWSTAGLTQFLMSWLRQD